MWRVAIGCGYPHPDLMLDKLTARQGKELSAYVDLEGDPAWQADLRAAQVCAMVLAAPAEKSHIRDFMPSFHFGPDSEPRGMTVEEGMAIIAAFNASAQKKSTPDKG